MGEAMDEMDRILAKLFMNLPPEKTSEAHGGPLDLVLRALMLLLSLATGLLQSARHLLGMLIMKTIPVGGMPCQIHLEVGWGTWTCKTPLVKSSP